MNIFCRSTRRTFLTGTAAGVVSAALPFHIFGKSSVKSETAVKISKIELFPCRYPTKGYFKFFTGPNGSQGRAAVTIKITTDNGLVGWGQSVPIARWSYETLESATITLKKYYIPALVGRDPTDIEGALGAMSQVVANGFSTGMPITRAGIDIALHDLLGKIRNKSLPELWGKKPLEKLTLSWTLNPRKISDVATLVEEGRKQGYRHFNIKVAPNIDFDVAVAREVRKLAPETFLWADANGGYDPATALKAAPKLADSGVDVLEAPIQPNRISGYQALKKQGALPIYMDEGVISPIDLKEFIRLEMLDGVAMKPSRCGGLVSARKQIELVTSKGLGWLGSGLTDPDISLAATLGLYGAYGYKKPAALNGHQFLATDILKEKIKVKDGEIYLPTGPGLGIEIDEDKLGQLSQDFKKSKKDKKK